MAGFEVTLHGRFWVTPEELGATVRFGALSAPIAVKFRLHGPCRAHLGQGDTETRNGIVEDQFGYVYSRSVESPA